MEPATAHLEHATGTPAPQLASFVCRYTGYRYSGMEPGSHLGLPGPALTMVISLGPPTRLDAMPDARQPPGAFDALVGGLHTRPAVIGHDGELYGIQVDLTARGARAILGVPAGEIAWAVLPLDDVLGRTASEVRHRLHAAPGWATRFAILDRLFTGRLGAAAPAAPQLEQAWRLLVAGRDVGATAEAVGWSRRHLNARFTVEYGLTPKQLGRVARFDRSHQLIRQAPTMKLVDVAAACGYYDQAHMAREWNDLAGVPASTWATREELPFVQDREPVATAS